MTIQLIDKLPEISATVKQVESMFPEGGKGAAKLEAVRGILETLDAAYTELWPKVSKLIAVLVAFFNVVGIFKKKAG